MDLHSADAGAATETYSPPVISSLQVADAAKRQVLWWLVFVFASACCDNPCIAWHLPSTLLSTGTPASTSGFEEVATQIGALPPAGSIR